ncbi:MAG: hypothetical protein WB420_03895, partial [Bradyrhizobium sp.]
MAQVITLVASADFGQTGQYIAKLTGRAAKVQFRREFCGTKEGKRSQDTRYETDEIGLYEVNNQTRKGRDRDYWLILPRNDGLVKLRTDHEDALLICKRLDAGEQIEDVVIVELGDELKNSDGSPKLGDNGKQMHALVYRIFKAGEAKKAVAAVTLDAAVEAIVQALAALPVSEQKKALTAARTKLFPKPPTETADAESAAAVN